MARETVFVDFKMGDISEIENKSAELSQKEQKAFTEGNKELEKRREILKENTEEQQKQVTAVKEKTAAEKAATAEQQKQVTQKKEDNRQLETRASLVAKNVTSLGKQLQIQKAIDDSFRKQFVSAKTVGDQIIALGNVFEAAFKTGGAENVQAVFDSLQNEISSTGLTVEQFVKQLENVDPATALVTEDTRKLGTQLREVRNEMTQLVVNGQKNTEQYKQLEQRAIALSGAQTRVNASIKDGVKSTAIIDGTVQTVEALNAGFQLAVGATALFGETNKELAETFEFLNGVMILTNGIEQITTILKNKDNIITKALIVTQNAFTTALYGTTAGLTAVQTAIAATGVGALIIALSLAIAKLADYISHLHDATEAQKDFSDTMDFLNTSLENANRQLEVNGNKAVEQAKRQADSFQDVYDVQQAVLNRRVQNQKAFTNAMTQEINKLTKGISDADSQTAKDYKHNKEKMNEDLQKAVEARTASLIKEEELEAQHDINVEKHKTESYQRRIKALEKYQAESNEIYNRTAQYQIEQEDIISADATKQYNTRLTALENAFKLRQNLIEKQRQQELAKAAKDTTTTNETILNINDKFNTERDKAYNEFFQKRKELTLQNEKDIAQAQALAQQNGITMRLQAAEIGSRKQFELQNELLRAQADAQKQQITLTVTNEKLRAAQIEAIDVELQARQLDNFERYNRERLRNATEVERAINDLATARANASIVGKDPNSPEVFKTRQQTRERYLQETLDEMARLQSAYDSGQIKDKEQFEKDYNKLEIDAANKRVDILKAEADRRKAIQDAIRDQAFSIAQTLSDAVFASNDANRQAELDKQQQQLDAARQNELDNANLTEQQKAQINERYDARERQLKRRAAEQDKQAAIVQATINAALAVTKAFATLAFPFNLIQAAAVAVATGIQVAKIKSQPLPAYAKGTKSAAKGSALVGEEGPEIKYMQGGEIVLTHEETKKVLTYATTKQVINETVGRLTNRNYVTGTGGTLGGIDYVKLGREVGKQFKRYGLKVESNLDKDGFSQYIHESGIKTEYLNKRYKLG